MKEKLKKIIKHYGPRNQLKKLVEEVFEFIEAVIDYENDWNSSDTTIGIMQKDKEHMEEEIKVLENCWVMTTDHVLDDGNIALKLAIKNFIKGYRQLEKENIRLKYQDIPYLEGTIKGYKARTEELEVNQCDHNISNECIRKSVIRDKIEETNQEDYFKKYYYDYQVNEYDFARGYKKCLKEILGDE